MTPAAKRIVALSAIVLLSLALAGLVTGAIGASLLAGDDEEPDSFLSRPEPHIRPQKVFVSPEDGLGGEEEHGAGLVGSGDGFVVTNTLLSSWIVTLLLIGLFYFATRRMEVVPHGLQNFMEAAVEALHNFVQGVAGAENAHRFLPLIATIFLFVMANAWVGLLPIYPSLGFLDDHGEMTRHLLRPAGTDLNMPLAL
ncbi:MAG: F0F1 ATP synthase subunit A, partial [Chloroflexi bacterium]|nr:F0F1 ATP synthase subunit A [Chloroflexota bacterium]